MLESAGIAPASLRSTCRKLTQLTIIGAMLDGLKRERFVLMPCATNEMQGSWHIPCCSFDTYFQGVCRARFLYCTDPSGWQDWGGSTQPFLSAFFPPSTPQCSSSLPGKLVLRSTSWSPSGLSPTSNYCNKHYQCLAA